MQYSCQSFYHVVIPMLSENEKGPKNILLPFHTGTQACTHPFTLKQKVPRESLAKMHRTVQNPVFCSELLRNKNECEN